MSLEGIVARVIHELARADHKHGQMEEPIEGLHTLKCEIAELEREVMRRHRNIELIEREGTQVAAMAIKFLRDCT